MNGIRTRYESDQLATARRLLKRRAAHGGELDSASGLSAGMAFWTLESVHPPFPPIGDVDDLPLPAASDILRALSAAAEHSTSVEETAAIARASRELSHELAP